MDPLDIAHTVVSIICFILALQYGETTHPWYSSVVIGLLVGFVVIPLALGVWEFYQGEYAMLVPRLISQRSLWSVSTYPFFFAGSYLLLLYYLPIYFQSIKGVDSIKSGVEKLPMIIAAGFSVLDGGITVAKTGHAVPFIAAGAALATVGMGLLHTLGVHRPSGKWIGYQIAIGAALASPFQDCVNVTQANVDAKDLASATSILYCTSPWPCTDCVIQCKQH